MICIYVLQGVHLEEPLTPAKSWDVDPEQQAKLDLLLQQDSTCTLSVHSPPSGPVGGLMGECGGSRLSGVTTMRISKSESPKPLCGPAGYDRGVVHGIQSLTVSSALSTSSSRPHKPTIMPESTSDSKVDFTLSSDLDSDGDSAGAATPGCSHPAVCTAGAGKSTTGADTTRHKAKGAGGKGRFKKMLRPLRRSHSAGCSQDVPAHALFLKYQNQRQPPQVNQYLFSSTVQYAPNLFFHILHSWHPAKHIADVISWGHPLILVSDFRPHGIK